MPSAELSFSNAMAFVTPCDKGRLLRRLHLISNIQASKEYFPKVKRHQCNIQKWGEHVFDTRSRTKRSSRLI